MELTLPQLAAVLKTREQRDKEGWVKNPSNEWLAANLARHRARDDDIIRQLEAGLIR